jgi:TonB family protein
MSRQQSPALPASFATAAALGALVSVFVAAPATAAPAASAERQLAVRYALVVGNRGEARLPDFGRVLSDRLMADYLTQWDPHSDNPEILRLFALEGLSEVARQAARLPAAGGEMAGTATVGSTDWRVDLDVRPRDGGAAAITARIARDGEPYSAPMVVSRLGEKAIVSTQDPTDGSFLFLVAQVDNWPLPGERATALAAPGAAREAAIPPRVVGRTPIPYPESEKAAGRQGSVILALDVDRTGKVTAARVARSLGPAFDAAALAAVRQWRFEPARRAGAAVAFAMELTVNFHP